MRHKASSPPILIFLLLCSGTGKAAPAQQLPSMRVESSPDLDTSTYSVDLAHGRHSVVDSAELLKSVPGANVNSNGPLTGHAQYRGMFADRIDILIDGMNIANGGPNGMDPGLSYVPPSLLDSLTVELGIAPVSSGMETLGGAIRAQTRTIDFAEEESTARYLDFAAGAGGVNASVHAGGLVGLASDRHRVQVLASYERAGDTGFPGGDILPTEYRRANLGGSYGFRSGAQEWGIRYRRNETGESGTPALPMDILSIDSDLGEIDFQGQVGDKDVSLLLFASHVDHRMDNYSLRDPMQPTATRQNHARSDGWGYRGDMVLELARGELKLGMDGKQEKHDSLITDPVFNARFRVDNFKDVRRNLYGFFAEWNGTVSSTWDLQVGGRYNRVSSDAGEVGHFMAAMNPAIALLQQRFNNADRSQSNDNIDLVVKLGHAISRNTRITVEAGRKTRAPSYQERYLWIPLQATNGLADGHNYVGNIDLDSEVSYELGMALDFRIAGYYLQPRAFYRYVDDYIQGIPSRDPLVIMVSTANGDPEPLQWDNVEASFYGLDAALGREWGEHWRIDAVLSYVRGKREDMDDDLYRIAPLNGRATVTYRHDSWWTALELVGYARQNRVSKTNGEQATPGYGLLHLRVGMDFSTVRLNAGIENVFDREYTDHLTGINRVSGSDVRVGDPLPGAGRNFYLGLEYHYN